MSKKVPDIPFQMLLRGANAVGYTNYPDNVVQSSANRLLNLVWTYYVSLIISIALIT